MKKNEYVSPEMEIVEITEQCNILAGSDNQGNLGDGGINDGEGLPDGW